MRNGYSETATSTAYLGFSILHQVVLVREGCGFRNSEKNKCQGHIIPIKPSALHMMAAPAPVGTGSGSRGGCIIQYLLLQAPD